LSGDAGPVLSITDRDGVDAPPAVLVSESFARARFGSIDAVGRRIQIGLQEDHEPWLTVASVVGDVRYDRLDLEPRQAIYEPHAMNPLHYTRLVARTSGDPSRFEPAIRAAIHDFDPLAAVFHVQPMDSWDPATHIGAAGLLAFVALLASLIGARAITRLDPLTALKTE
jgi:hypothetical protein